MVLVCPYRLVCVRQAITVRVPPLQPHRLTPHMVTPARLGITALWDQLIPHLVCRGTTVPHSTKMIRQDRVWLGTTAVDQLP